MGILDYTIDEQELKVFESAYARAAMNGVLDDKIIFEYAVCLVQSPTAVDIRKGIRFLMNLSKESFDINYMYYLAIGHAHLKEYEPSLKYIDAVLNKDSFHRQAKELKAEIMGKGERERKQDRQETLQAAAVVGGGLLGVVGAIGLAAFALSKSSKKNNNN